MYYKILKALEKYIIIIIDVLLPILLPYVFLFFRNVSPYYVNPLGRVLFGIMVIEGSLCATVYEIIHFFTLHADF